MAKAEDQFSGCARMLSCKSGICGVDGKWFGGMETAGEVDGLSHRSLMCGIRLIWGHEALRVLVK
jgi:hypothetical protein